jgi:conjugal transfer pilus assembly protein TraK
VRITTINRFAPAAVIAALLWGAQPSLAAPAAPVAASAPVGIDFGTPVSSTAGSANPGHPARRAPAKARRVSPKAAVPSAPNLRVLDPRVEVKDTPPREIDLPGVMKVAGIPVDAQDPTRFRKIPLTDGGVTTVYMSTSAPNRIELPFDGSETHHRDTLQVDHGKGHNLYVYWKADKPEEETMFIEPMGGGPVLALDIVPKDIPAQTLLVTDDTGIVAGHQKPAASTDDYIAHVQDLMEAVALSHTPNGYSEVDMTLPPIAMNGLSVTADRRYSGATDDIYVYTARDLGKTRATISEEEFDGANVLAVSIFPKPVLMPGESTRVVVLARKREEQ